MKKTVLFVLMTLPVLLSAQSWKEKPISISIFNNATMLPPASLVAVFNQPIHPGLTASYEFGWKETDKHKWFQNAGISYMYHRYVYQAIILNSQAGYRWKLNHFSVEGYLQAGYMHAFLLTDRAVLQSDGTYLAKKGFGKPQFLTGAGMGFGYNLGDGNKLRRIFINYDFRIQMPFVKSYVTMLPNGTLSLGLQFTLRNSKSFDTDKCFDK
jgi:hypothetical protein